MLDLLFLIKLSILNSSYMGFWLTVIDLALIFKMVIIVVVGNYSTVFSPLSNFRLCLPRNLMEARLDCLF